MASRSSKAKNDYIDSTGAVKIFPESLPPNGDAGGDLLGTYPNPTVNWTNGSAYFISASRQINTAYPLEGGGDLSQDRTISIPPATSITGGYLTAAKFVEFTNKQDALVSGVNIKTVNTNSLLGSGNISVGTVTQVQGNGTVSGITLTGNVTTNGNLTLGGTLALTSGEVTTALGYTPENVANKTDVMAGNTTSSTKYLSAKGVYDWVISQAYITAAALTGYATQTWVTSQGYITNVITSLGYTPENVANKSDSYTVSSSTTYASTKAVVDGLATKQASLGYTAENVANKSDSYTVSSSTTYASTKAVVDGLATKQNSLGYTAEDTSNKSSSYTLSSTTTYANTKALVDGLATKQNTITQGNLTEATSAVLTITGGTSAVIGSGTTLQVKQSSTSQDGYLSSADWNTFNNKQASLGFTAVPNTRTISTTSPLSGGGDLSANRTLSIADAAADGSTKGAATFTAADFNSSSGLISIDYTNGQAASTSNKGFLTAADWNTFNNKLSGITYESTTNSTAVTGTTANTVGSSRLISGGTFAVGDIVYIMLRGVKTGTAGALTLRIYTNTSAVIAGATLVASYNSTTATNIFLQIERNLLIKTATNTEVVSTTGNLLSDAAVTSAVSALNIDWTTDKYIIFAIQNGNNADSTVISGYKIWKI